MSLKSLRMSLITFGVMGFLPIGNVVAETGVDLAKSVMDRVEQELPVGAYNIKVSAIAGQVTLSGEVADPVMRDKALQVAQTTGGVTAVINELRSPEPITDAQLAERVKNALIADSIDVSPLKIHSTEKMVEISGDQPNHEAIDRILTVALMVPGVLSVDSNMTLKGKPYREGRGEELRVQNRREG